MIGAQMDSDAETHRLIKNMINVEVVILHWEKGVFSTNFDALFNNLLENI